MKDNVYVKSQQIHSSKVFIRLLNEPSLPDELYAYSFDFNSDGFLKLSLAFDKDGNVGEQVEYDINGRKAKKIDNHNFTATFQRPSIDTTIYKYRNGLLTEEEEINEDFSFGRYRKKDSYKRLYLYDEYNRLIQREVIALPNNSSKINKFAYVNSNLMKEYDILNDGAINMIIFHKSDNEGRIIEKKAVKSEDEYYDINNKFQYYRHFYLYNNLGLLQEIQSFDNMNLLKSNEIHIYDINNNLLRVEEYENGNLSIITRFEYERQQNIFNENLDGFFSSFTREQKAIFIGCLLIVARSDGQIHPKEDQFIEEVESLMGLSLGDPIFAIIESGGDSEFYRILNSLSIYQKHWLILTLHQMVMADGKIERTELEHIVGICVRMGISETEMLRIIQQSGKVMKIYSR
ncbi:MAG: TerB family tellurite resistance protein [Acholeplasma sp.]|nr:TerB family tellurite resistance protein [Acholeplasma sp.]